VSITLTTTYGFQKPGIGSESGLWGGDLNANADSIDAEIARPRLPFNSPTVGATTTLDLSLARVFKWTTSQATTIAITNVPANTFFARITCIIVNGGAFAITWPASVARPPALKNSGTDVVELVTTDNGTTWSNVSAGHSLVLFQDFNKTTSSTSTVSITSFTLGANTLVLNGQALRINVRGITNESGTTLVQVLVGASPGGSVQANVSISGALTFALEIIIARTGTGSGVGTLVQNVSTTSAAAKSTISSGQLNGAAWSSTQTVDVRGNVQTGTNVLTIDSVEVELLPAV
jgi:hypothetical protein